MIDLHAHVLPALDDGPTTVPDAVALVQAMAEDGVRAVAATSHVSDAYPARPEALAAGREVLRAALVEADVDVQILPGAEVALEQLPALDADDLAALRLGAGPWLLVESPLSVSAGDFDPIIDGLQRDGHRVLLAHPERCPAFQRDPGRLARLVAAGALCSVTAGALVGRFGRTARRLGQELLADGLVHNVASDAHDFVGRPPGLRADLERAAADLDGLAELVPWLTEGVPTALLAADEPPPPPVSVSARAPRRRRHRPARRRR